MLVACAAAAWVGFPSLLQASDWVQVNRTPGGTFRDAVYANSKFVVVGDAGLVWTSPDGLNWTVRTSGTTNNIYKVTYGAGLYVAVGYHGLILTSPDGITWTERKPAVGDSLTSVVYNGSNLYVTAGVNGRLLTSSNGTSWTERTPWTGEEVDALCYGNSLYIAVTSGGSVYRSSNGLNWTPCDLDTGINNKGAVYANGMYIIGGGANGISASYFSTDGINWTKAKHALANYFMDFDYDGGHYISCGNSDGFGCSMIMTSVNGITWIRDRTPDYSTLLGCASSTARSIAVGTRRLIISNTAAGLGDGRGCSSSAANIVVTSPNGGENYSSAKTYQIQWTDSNITGNLQISLWKNKAQVGIIDDNVDPTPGYYDWAAGDYIGGKAPAGSGYMIIVEDKGTGAADMSDASFSIYDPPPLTIAAPNGGESLSMGSIQGIMWETNNVSGLLKLTLWKNDAYVGVLVNKLTPSRTFFVWSAGRLANGTYVAAGSGYKVKIEERGTANSDLSDASFTISGSPAIIVTAPKGGETLYSGSNSNITWNAVSISGKVRLTLWKDMVQVGIIADNLNASPGSYSWTVGNYIGGTALGIGYRVKVEAIGTSIFGGSDGPFEIANPTTIALTFPNGGESLALGGTADITWTASGVRRPLIITLWKDGVPVGMISRGVDPTRNSFRWTVGAYLGGTTPAGTGYTIKIHEDGTAFFDTSDAPFTITDNVIKYLPHN